MIVFTLLPLAIIVMFAIFAFKCPINSDWEL